MKKLLLYSLALSTVLGAGAQSTPSVEWGNLIDGGTNAGDQSTAVCLDSEGYTYWFGTYGSKTDLPTVNYCGEVLFTGAPYEGTSQNNNFTVLKTNAAGEKQWVVASNSGDFSNNTGGMSATADGGVVVAVAVRHTDGMTDRNINLLQADGTDYAVDWTAADASHRQMRLLVTKLSKAGMVEWYRLLEFSSNPGPAASGNNANYWSNCFNVGTVATDDNDNIYLALNYRNQLTVAKADNSTVTLTPQNNTTWTGDPQTAAGDFLLLGLDKDGYYRNSLTLSGSATAAYCQKVRYIDGKIYAQGYINGDGGKVTVAGNEYTPNKGVSNPLLVCADTDMNVLWSNMLLADKVDGKYGWQNCGMNVVNGNLWLVAQCNVKLTACDDPTMTASTSQGGVREGMLLKFDATDGKWLAARSSRQDDFPAKNNLTGYMDVIANPDNADDVYVIGYALNTGVFMRRYDANTLVADLEGDFNIVKGGGSPSYQTSAYDGPNGVLYLTARGNKAFTYIDGGESTAPEKWGILATKVKLPADLQTSGVGSVTIVEDDMAPVEYYNLQGLRIANPQSGLFIRRQGTKVSKVIL